MEPLWTRASQWQRGLSCVATCLSVCSGGIFPAGQGYLWLAHRDPASPMWQLAARSKELWLELQDGEGAWEEAEWQVAAQMP